ncbi:hypothetical protein CAPN002_15750 [Capnocytophaga stomatis]|nr:hypothetical protein CAPN002_15750 [Capnocytophaga stomatis]GIM48838.1 hypothetical protein CAPN003_02900 [Capnocytophaga stomatis]
MTLFYNEKKITYNETLKTFTVTLHGFALWATGRNVDSFAFGRNERKGNEIAGNEDVGCRYLQRKPFVA